MPSIIRAVPVMLLLGINRMTNAVKLNDKVNEPLTTDAGAPSRPLFTVKRPFDSINHASDLNEQFKRSFDSISHASDLDEDERRIHGNVKKNFDPIEHVSDLNELKRGFDSIDHTSDLEEGKRTVDTAGERLRTSSKLNKALEIAIRDLMPELHPGKRMFDSIGHATDLDGFKRSFDSIQHSSDMDEVKRPSPDAFVDELRRFAEAAALQRLRLTKAGIKRNFDPIDHMSDIEAFKRSRNSGKRLFDSIEHATDMGDVKRTFDSIEHASDMDSFSLTRKRRESSDSAWMIPDISRSQRLWQEIAHHTLSAVNYLSLYYRKSAKYQAVS